MNNRESEIPLCERYHAIHLYLLTGPNGKRLLRVQTILDTVQISRSQLYYLKNKWEKKRSLSDSPRKGRPSKVTPQGDTRLKILAKTTPLKAYKRMAEDYSQGLPLPSQISLWTVRRHLINQGILAFRPMKKTVLDPRQIAARYLWAREYKPLGMGYWESVVFSDETRILLQETHPSVKVKRPRNSRYESKFIHYAEKYGGGGISFWGAITYWGPGPLYRLYGSMDEVSYTNVLGILKLELQEMGIDQFVLQDDNLSSHRTAVVEGVKDTLEIEAISSWPSNSPDLSPIENIWAIWKERVHNRKPGTLSQLEKIANEEWNNLEPSLFRRLYESMPNRIRLLINARGRRIRY